MSIDILLSDEEQQKVKMEGFISHLQEMLGKERVNVSCLKINENSLTLEKVKLLSTIEIFQHYLHKEWSIFQTAYTMLNWQLRLSELEAEQLACNQLVLAFANLEQDYHKYPQNNPAICRRVHSIIEKDYKTLTLAETANVLRITSPYLCHTLSSNTGCSFLEALNCRRILASMQYMLTNIDGSTEQASLMSGFHSIHYYYRVFRHYTGCSPVFVRKNLLAQSDNYFFSGAISC